MMQAFYTENHGQGRAWSYLKDAAILTSNCEAEVPSRLLRARCCSTRNKIDMDERFLSLSEHEIQKVIEGKQSEKTKSFMLLKFNLDVHFYL